jgi:hypothetical protein
MIRMAPRPGSAPAAVSGQDSIVENSRGFVRYFIRRFAEKKVPKTGSFLPGRSADRMLLRKVARGVPERKVAQAPRIVALRDTRIIPQTWQQARKSIEGYRGLNSLRGKEC